VAPALVDTARAYFADTHEFFDDVLGAIALNQLERDCVDTPEFQRLFRISQLGFVDFVYHAANHTRGTHSIGACATAKRLVDRINANTARATHLRSQVRRQNENMPIISMAERSLISLAGLLHDIPHGPLSHDLEKKTHRYTRNRIKMRSYYGPYDKHDNFEDNPALYLMLFDHERSVLARVLRYHSPAFRELLESESAQSEFHHLHEFNKVAKEWKPERQNAELLPSLLFHLLAFETIQEAVAGHSISIATKFDGPPSDWGLGPTELQPDLHRAWYQPFRHDIVGDTLSADLLDYLPRDAARLGIHAGLDGKLLEYHVLVSVPSEQVPKESGFTSLFQCAIDLNDYKRGVIRSERINDIFRLLDARHEIHEKAVYHRVVQAAIAMLARAIGLAADSKPELESLYAIGSAQHVMHGDDHFLERLASLPASAIGAAHSSISRKLIERRVYRPLMIVSGDDVEQLLRAPGLANLAEDNREEELRLLGAILDSPYFAPFFCFVCWCVERLLDHTFESPRALYEFIETRVCHGDDLAWAMGVLPRRVILWTTPYKQLYKDPAIVVRAGDSVGRIDDIVREYRLNGRREDSPPASVLSRLDIGLRNAEARYASMWKLYLFASDGLFYTGGLARILPDHPCRTDVEAHRLHVKEAEAAVARAIQTAWNLWGQVGATKKLDETMTPDEFKGILKSYTAQEARIREGSKGVNVDEYLHLKGDSHCRDVRYRFDRKANLGDCIAEVKLADTTEPLIREILRSAQIDLHELHHDELVDILSHLKDDLNAVEPAVREAARTGVQLDAKRIREIWLNAEIRGAVIRRGSDEARGTKTATRRDDGVPKSPGVRKHRRPRGADNRPRPGSSAQLGLIRPTNPTDESS